MDQQNGKRVNSGLLIAKIAVPLLCAVVFVVLVLFFVFCLRCGAKAVKPLKVQRRTVPTHYYTASGESPQEQMMLHSSSSLTGSYSGMPPAPPLGIYYFYNRHLRHEEDPLPSPFHLEPIEPREPLKTSFTNHSIPSHDPYEEESPEPSLLSGPETSVLNSYGIPVFYGYHDPEVPNERNSEVTPFV